MVFTPVGFPSGFCSNLWLPYNLARLRYPFSILGMLALLDADDAAHTLTHS
jgi:hypothetical protein